jgi:two-component system cell cycle response regulator
LRGDPAAFDAAVDIEMVRRIGALAWLLSAGLAAVMLIFWPPTHAIGSAGWAPALGGLLAIVALAVTTLVRRSVTLRVSLLASMFTVAVLGALAWLAGPDSEYMILIALPLMFVGAAQAPRRVGATVVVAAGVETFVIAGWPVSAGSIAAGVLRLIVWGVMAGLALVWTAGVRWQRLALRGEREHANQLALHDSITTLGNRRKLMADLEAAVAAHQPTVLALFDLNGFKAYNDSFGHPAGDALLTRLSAKLSALAGGLATAYRMGGDEFCLLARETGATGDALLALGREALSEQGYGFLITAAGGSASLPDEADDPVEALRLADGRMYADKHERRGRAASDGTEMLLAILQERDPALSDDSCAVSRLASRIGERLELSDTDQAQLVRAARLHDIGKLAIPDAILTKPGPLDDAEWEFVRRHPLIGERVTSLSIELEAVSRIIRSTHERFDGHGYPDRLAGEEIPLAARIITACDAYQAMGSQRAYRRRLPEPEIVRELRENAGTQFDPQVVAALLELLAEPATGLSAPAPAAPAGRAQTA